MTATPRYLSRVSESHDKTANQKSSYQIFLVNTHCTRQVARDTNFSVTLWLLLPLRVKTPRGKCCQNLQWKTTAIVSIVEYRIEEKWKL